MQNLNNKYENKYLIDYANIKSGIIKYQKNFLSEDEFYDFVKKPFKGMPLLLPFGLKSFDYSRAKNFFFIKKYFYYKNVYFLKDKKKINYIDKIIKIPSFFCTGAIPKKKFNNYIKKIIKQNLDIKKKIFVIKKRFKNIVAFQTRNIPHSGHLEIINYLLDKYNCVVINPLIGFKKSGDIKSHILKKIFIFLIKKKYQQKNIFYFPVVSNFFYAGPREALHHLNLREMLGFKHFLVGRDHAGIKNLYHPLDAYKFVKKYKYNFKIRVVDIKGAYFSSKTKRVEISNKFNNGQSLKDISGTNFRKYLKKKKIYNFADESLQKYIHKIKKNIFY